MDDDCIGSWVKRTDSSRMLAQAKLPEKGCESAEDYHATGDPMTYLIPVVTETCPIVGLNQPVTQDTRAP